MASNIRPIKDPQIAAALESAMASLQLVSMDRPVGMSTVRFEIFRAIGASWAIPTLNALTWAAHAKPAVIKEHLEGLRRLGLLEWGCIRLTDRGRSLFDQLIDGQLGQVIMASTR